MIILDFFMTPLFDHSIRYSIIALDARLWYSLSVLIMEYNSFFITNLYVGVWCFCYLLRLEIPLFLSVYLMGFCCFIVVIILLYLRTSENESSNLLLNFIYLLIIRLLDFSLIYLFGCVRHC